MIPAVFSSARMILLECHESLATFVNWIPIVDWYIGVASRMDAKRTCSNYGNHPRLNRQYNWGDLDDHLMSTILFTFIMA